jgi:hypothetical protein
MRKSFAFPRDKGVSCDNQILYPLIYFLSKQVRESSTATGTMWEVPEGAANGSRGEKRAFRRAVTCSSLRGSCLPPSLPAWLLEGSPKARY